MPAKSVSAEISHLYRKGPSKGPEKGKPYTHERAVATALSMKRAGKFKKKKKR